MKLIKYSFKVARDEAGEWWLVTLDDLGREGAMWPLGRVSEHEAIALSRELITKLVDAEEMPAGVSM